mmetsp:Transcript_37599/g.64089  ORF Transcript_37599/g.64089 Transcript_37599/m.64089 type:complete len:183 (+) Transcript_37599:445-993(+)
MDKRPGGAGSLDTFWRSAENFRSEATNDGQGMLWAVSQAAPLRRVHVANDLTLHDHGHYASGGFAANLRVDGALHFGSQQQWLTRNADLNPAKANETGGARGRLSSWAAPGPLRRLRGAAGCGRAANRRSRWWRKRPSWRRSPTWPLLPETTRLLLPLLLLLMAPTRALPQTVSASFCACLR